MAKYTPNHFILSAMFSLDDYTDQELLNILQCNKLHELYDLLDENKANEITDIIRKKPPIQIIPSKSIQALLVPITDTSSIPFILLGGILGIVGSGTIPMILCTAGILAASFAIMGYFFYANLKEIENKEYKNNKLLHLYRLKNQAADLYLKRNQLGIELLDKPSYSDKHQLDITNKALRASMVISTTLFGTYFLGLNALLSAFGFTVISTTLGPLGVILGVGIALGVGAYFGYRRYQMLKQDDFFKFEQKFQSVIVGKKTSLCQKVASNTFKESQIGELQKKKPVYSNKKTKEHNIFTFKLNKVNLFASSDCDSSHSKDNETLSSPTAIKLSTIAL